MGKEHLPALAGDTRNTGYPNQMLWRQTDYLQIANEVFEYQWREPASGWKLYRMLFDGNCQNNPGGFSHSIITYFKPVLVNSTQEYTVRQIEIYPQYNQIDWAGIRSTIHILFLDGQRSIWKS